jgi:hypothetical protein
MKYIRIFVGCIILAISTNAFATGLPGSGMQGVGEGIGFFVVMISAFVSIFLFVSKLPDFTKPESTHKGLCVSLAIFTFLSSPWLTEPELDIRTLIAVGLNYLFWILFFGFTLKGKRRRNVMFAAMSALTLLLLSNPKILSFNQYIYSSVSPFENSLKVMETLDSVSDDGESYSYVRSFSDGKKYFTPNNESFINTDDELQLIEKRKCVVRGVEERHQCLEVFAVRVSERALHQPTAIFDFQVQGDFPKGFHTRPSTLINFAIKDKTVHKFHLTRKGEVFPIDDSFVSRVASKRLRSYLCSKYRSISEIDHVLALLELGPDLFYTPATKNVGSIIRCAFSLSKDNLRVVDAVTEHYLSDPKSTHPTSEMQAHLNLVLNYVVSRHYPTEPEHYRIKLILKMGADINNTDGYSDYRRTPIMKALKYGGREGVASRVGFLLQNGALASATSKSGQKAIDIAEWKLSGELEADLSYIDGPNAEAERIKVRAENAAEYEKVISLLTKGSVD